MKWLADALMSSDVPDNGETSDMVMQLACGDELAYLGLCDKIEEGEIVMRSPFKKGDKVLIFTVTMYYIGEISDMDLGWIELKNASWIHWTGRLGSLLASQDLTQTHGNRKPRTEFMGDGVIVWLQAGVCAKRWTGKLPKESLS